MARSRQPEAVALLSVVPALFILVTVTHCSLNAPNRLSSQTSGASAEEIELAPFMGELQRLTHKLSLSVAHENWELAEFYLYESMQSIEEIKRRLPLYRGLPIALLIDQIASPRYNRLDTLLKRARRAGSDREVATALGELIKSCNQCHEATQHGFIRINNDSEHNPYNQNFGP